MDLKTGLNVVTTDKVAPVLTDKSPVLPVCESSSLNVTQEHTHLPLRF